MRRSTLVDINNYFFTAATLFDIEHGGMHVKLYDNACLIRFNMTDMIIKLINNNNNRLFTTIKCMAICTPIPTHPTLSACTWRSVEEVGVVRGCLYHKPKDNTT